MKMSEFSAADAARLSGNKRSSEVLDEEIELGEAMNVQFLLNCFSLLCLTSLEQFVVGCSDGEVGPMPRAGPDYSNFLISAESNAMLGTIARTGEVTGDWNEIRHVFNAKIYQV